jgi:hypothetical protein
MNETVDVDEVNVPPFAGSSATGTDGPLEISIEKSLQEESIKYEPKIELVVIEPCDSNTEEDESASASLISPSMAEI